MSSYSNQKIAEEYLNFINSRNGQIEQSVIFEVLNKYLPDSANAAILDAGCGQGWLSRKLSVKYKNICGCDISEPLIEIAKKEAPALDFKALDICTDALPYADAQFGCVILNMAAHSLRDQAKAFTNLNRVLKPGGAILMTIPNPYYAYLVGVWKRGLLGFILRRTPKLLLRPFWQFDRPGSGREFAWNQKFTSYFRPLSEQINNALAVGWHLQKYLDLYSEQDSADFDGRYQLHRFPIVLFLLYRKT